MSGIKALRKAINLTETASELRDLTVVQGSGLELDTKLGLLQSQYIDGLSDLEQHIAAMDGVEKLMELLSKLRKMGG